MSAIWLLTTHGRPEACQRTLDACEQTGMTSPGLVYVDETVDAYQDLRLPPNWVMHLEPEWGSIAASMNYCLEAFPDASHYGWLADDNIPLTPGWDKTLEAAAGEWCVSFAKDLWFSELNWVHPLGGLHFTSGLCWGRKLIDATGWWVLPGVMQGGIDAAWNDLTAILGLSRYVPEVVIEHLTWKIGKREEDATDAWVKKGLTYVATDVAFYENWCLKERAEVAEVIRLAMAA